MLNRGVMFGST